MIDLIKQKRAEVLKSKAIYQLQLAACDGALKILDDLLKTAEDDQTADSSIADPPR